MYHIIFFITLTIFFCYEGEKCIDTPPASLKEDLIITADKVNEAMQEAIEIIDLIDPNHDLIYELMRNGCAEIEQDLHSLMNDLD